MQPEVVVGAAIVRDGRVLACRRTAPVAVAGRWELPGGKVEPGETPHKALVREVREELGVDIELSQWLVGQAAIAEGLVLAVAVASITAGEPEVVDHDEVRWLAAHELDDLDWLDPDRPFLEQIRAYLSEGPPTLAP